MRITNSVAAAAVAALLAVAPASAQTTGMKNGSADTNTTKARCSPGDPNVMVDPKTKTYMMDTSASKGAMSGAKDGAMAGSSTSSGTASDNTNAAAGGSEAATGGAASGGSAMPGKSGAMTGMKSMCKSEADSMGAKMAPTGMQKKSM